MVLEYALFLFILVTAVTLSVVKNKLTVAGALAGSLIACLIFWGAGFTGIAMLGLFFILGSAATSWKIHTKETLHAAEENKGKRKINQVIANGGVAAITGLLSSVIAAQQPLLQLMMAAALSSATADTLSSELGTLYGKKFFNILTLKKDTRGENGVVSIEGVLFGITGSTLIASVYAMGFGWNKYFFYIIIAGTIGNLADSILGATLERKHRIPNDAVNILNTLIAALIAWALAGIF